LRFTRFGEGVRLRLKAGHSGPYPRSNTCRWDAIPRTSFQQRLPSWRRTSYPLPALCMTIQNRQQARRSCCFPCEES